MLQLSGYRMNLNNEDFTSRSVLYAKFDDSGDTIHLIVNHWPSRRGGVLAGEETGFRIAAMIREKADSIIAEQTRQEQE